MHPGNYAILADIISALLLLVFLEFGYFPGRLTSFWKRLMINLLVIGGDDNNTNNTNINQEARNARLHATLQDTRKRQVRFREEDLNYKTSKEGSMRNRITKTSLSQHPVLTVEATAEPKPPSKHTTVEPQPPSKRVMDTVKYPLKRWRPKPPSKRLLATVEPTPPSKQLLDTVTQAMEFHLLKLWYTAYEIGEYILHIPKATKSFWKQSLSAVAVAVAYMIEALKRSRHFVREIDSEEDTDDECEIEAILILEPTEEAESLGVQLPTDGVRPQTRRPSETKHYTPIMQQIASVDTLNASIRGRVVAGKFYPEGIFEPKRPCTIIIRPQIPFPPLFSADPLPCLFSSTVDSLLPSHGRKPTPPSPSLASQPVRPQSSVDYDPKSQSDFFDAMRKLAFRYPAAESRGAEGTVYPDVTYTAEEREERIREIKNMVTLPSAHLLENEKRARAEAKAKEVAAAAKAAAKRHKQEEAAAKARAKKRNEKEAAAEAKAKKRQEEERARANNPPPNQVETSLLEISHLPWDDPTEGCYFLRISFPCLQPTPFSLSPPLPPPSPKSLFLHGPSPELSRILLSLIPPHPDPCSVAPVEPPH